MARPLGPIVEENGIASAPVDGGKVEWPVTFIEDAPPPPPPPPPAGRVIGIGDSWVDRFSSSCTEGFNPMWNEVLGVELDVPVNVYGRCGAYTAEIDGFVDDYINAGPQPDDKVFYWFFLNDFNDAGQTIEQSEVDNILNRIENNLTTSFSKIPSNTLYVLSLPRGRQVPLMVQLGAALIQQDLLDIVTPGVTPEEVADRFIDLVNDRIYAAAANAGVTDRVVDMRVHFDANPPEWLPKGKHFDAQTNIDIGEYLATVI